jgi:hypothetical protein
MSPPNIVLGLALYQQGLPVASDVFSGDTSDALTVVPMLARLKHMGLCNIAWVADRGMASAITITSVRAAISGKHKLLRQRAARERHPCNLIPRRDGNPRDRPWTGTAGEAVGRGTSPELGLTPLGLISNRMNHHRLARPSCTLPCPKLYIGQACEAGILSPQRRLRLPCDC